MILPLTSKVVKFGWMRIVYRFGRMLLGRNGKSHGKSCPFVA